MTTNELGYLLLGFGIGVTAGYHYVAWISRKYFLTVHKGVVEVREEMETLRRTGFMERQED